MLRIFEQSSVDLYLIDYEKPNNATKQINGWRKIFLANQWLELDSGYVQHDPFMVLVWFVFFWVGLGWKNYGQSDPNWSVEENAYLPNNRVLVFGIVSPLYILITLGIYLFNYIYDWVVAGESPMNQFIDLACIANVSMLFIEEESFGYYLHGRAPWGSSDIPLDWLSKEIKDESSADTNNPKVSRGLQNTATKNKDQVV